jgi:hypothetical protein
MDIKERIDGLNEVEAKAALAWLLNYALEATPCEFCTVEDCETCEADNQADCEEKFLSFAIEEGKQ